MDCELRNMVMAFRVTELQSLLGYAGCCRTGRKIDLQARALDLVRSKQSHVVTKIRELYKTIQLTLNQQPPVASSGMYGSNSSSSSNRLYTLSSGYDGAHEKTLQGRPPFSNFNSTSEGKVQNNMAYVSLPICPDVKIKKLPFFDILSELIKPTSLISSGPVRMQEGTFPFFLTPQQASEIAASKELLGGSVYPSEQKIGYQLQVQLRFCLLDSTCEQTDNFPPSICVRVNGKIVTLPHPIPSNRPGVEPKRPSKPLNVTNYVKLSPTCTNTVGITWVSDGLGRGWVMCLYLVRKLNSADLLSRLKVKGPRPAEFTKGMIKEIVSKDDGDCQIAMTSLKVSTACPLGKCRMTLPCRASTCSHLQCFDANLFLQMNEKKPTWNCPVCDKPLMFENLSIDGYFLQVINSLSFDSNNEVEVLPDGNWCPISVKREKEDGPPAKRLKSEVHLDSTICLDDDVYIDDSQEASSSHTQVKNSNSDKGKITSTKTVEVVDLTISDSDDNDDDEEEEVTAVRIRRKPPRIHDESSSSSSSSTSSSSSSSSSSTTSGTTDSVNSQPQSLPGSRKAGNSSPAVITLDSPSASPEPCRNLQDGRGEASCSTSAGSSHQSSNVLSSHSYLQPIDSDWNSKDAIFRDLIRNHTSEASSLLNPNRHPSPSPTLLANPAYTGTQPSGLLDSRTSWDTGFQINDSGSLNFGAFDFGPEDFSDQLYNSTSNSSYTDFSNIW
ncbi:unnamed protein product [Allacma fusca]|uniref:E3 SUMO-protein ligase PIAS1 n=1 Tax=Allacma fusca TaxID=39272 RepID=A0A8J2KT33_9HEXA|nr:unnamed protein product [Allacma fusca]